MYIRLNHIKVPLFKVLSDINLEFPADLVPHVYPIAGKNGSGKSLLLQLIYLLLTGIHPDRHPYLKTLLDGLPNSGLEDGNNTVARIELDINGRFLNLHYFAIPHRNLTAKEVERLTNQTNFDRFAAELVESEVLPIYYVPEDYLLLCAFEWQNPASETAKIDRQECAKLFNEIGRRVFLASYLSDIPHFVANSSTTAAQSRQLVSELPYKMPNYHSLDPNIGWWDSPASATGAGMPGLRSYLNNIYAGNDGSIVLIDGIDAGMDADNQYGVVESLRSISPTNQYLVATTSFELCQALTPAHVYSL